MAFLSICYMSNIAGFFCFFRASISVTFIPKIYRNNQILVLIPAGQIHKEVYIQNQLNNQF